MLAYLKLSEFPTRLRVSNPNRWPDTAPITLRKEVFLFTKPFFSKTALKMRISHKCVDFYPKYICITIE